MRVYLLLIFTTIAFCTKAQNVGIGTTTPDTTAALDVSATNKGMLIPRLTTAQRAAITVPATGLLVYDTDKGTVMFFDGSHWRGLSFSDGNNIAPQNQNATEPSSYATFGFRVSISGNYAIIGAPHAEGIGLAYIFNKTSNGWRQMARLSAYDASAGSTFGGAVAISGDYAIVGSQGKMVNGNTAQGKAYIYHRVGSNWSLDVALVKPDGLAGQRFGFAVGICAFNSGGVGAVIGIPYSRGQVYCYKKGGDTWSYVQNIVPSDLASTDYYGSTIAMDKDYMAIGAVRQDNTTFTAVDAGAVYLYVLNGGTWKFQQKISGGTPMAQFGYSISLSFNKVAIGAPFASAAPGSSASVVVYERTGTTWNFVTDLRINNVEALPNASSISPTDLLFGASVGLSGSTLLIGAPGTVFAADAPFITGHFDVKGGVYIYKNLSGTTYTMTKKLQSDFPFPYDLYGGAVGISDGKYIIGCWFATVNGLSHAGNVYFGTE